MPVHLLLGKAEIIECRFFSNDQPARWPYPRNQFWSTQRRAMRYADPRSCRLTAEVMGPVKLHSAFIKASISSLNTWFVPSEIILIRWLHFSDCSLRRALSDGHRFFPSLYVTGEVVRPPGDTAIYPTCVSKPTNTRIFWMGPNSISPPSRNNMRALLKL